jgi:hypothetical protein
MSLDGGRRVIWEIQDWEGAAPARGDDEQDGGFELVRANVREESHFVYECRGSRITGNGYVEEIANHRSEVIEMVRLVDR